ncbi:glycerol-3-phosphate phosphatase [Onthophagus taurus]|uniref:glycerol-3-phosphate phosphatase n=1 Tax=Onthophagus taurus TaxID=166361 RepID=UPI000C1FF3CD|nr:glycerol-3-phosphate phosphatase [Onthophagus taurus]XP_022899818.1 glycerol-3-phosphate phosphatase [Onthophagus taurus]
MSTRQASKLEDLPQEELKSFFDNFDVILTDCDGVIWIENNVITGAPMLLNQLRDNGKKVFFVTNNSTKTREEFVNKAKGMGIECDINEVMSTSYLAASYLKSLNFKSKVYIVGSSGISKELELVGIESIGVGPDVLNVPLNRYLDNYTEDPEVGAVIVGFDQHISYPKMMKAATYINQPNCLFIATNTDERFPREGSYVIPGSGAIVKAIETCAGKEPVLMGKPGTYIYDALKKLCDIDPKRTLMIGDRCNTDILLGTRCGFQTLLVLTGVTRLEEVENWKKSTKQSDLDLVPDFVTHSIGDLLKYL